MWLRLLWWLGDRFRMFERTSGLFIARFSEFTGLLVLLRLSLNLIRVLECAALLGAV
jgi:hypothetical protein